MTDWETDVWHMARALELAARGEGFVEPNPMVGCTLARDGETVGEGFHHRFGAEHAEVEALRSAGSRAAGATAYVTLEPCCHHGKTPPCTQTLIRAGVARVVVAQLDPFPRVAGQGVAELQAAGIAVEVGLCGDEARALAAPYRRLVEQGRPWVIAKWAMTLDGKLATASGDSRWISSEASRAIVHRLRGRVDAILVGAATAATDDPLLTARPAGSRAAVRIVLDSRAALRLDSRLVRTARERPVLVAVSADAPPEQRARLAAAGCEVFEVAGSGHGERLGRLLAELGRRRMTNLLVEGGGRVLGELFDADLVDEVHAFVAPKIVGGRAAPSPVGGRGLDLMNRALRLERPRIETSGSDAYISGRISRAP